MQAAQSLTDNISPITDAKAVVLHAQQIQLAYQRKKQPPQTILSEFSLQLKAGELVAVLGPSGVGKSSLLRVLAGLQKANAGSVHIHQQLISGPHPRLSFMFQDPSLLPWLNLEQNVAFGLTFKHQTRLSKSERKQRVAQAIAEVDLQHATKAYPRELSGGMAQRVALARALARQPEILLLDEPFSALDEITRSEMQQLLRQVTKRHKTAVVLVTHDIDEALLLADRVIMLGGKPGRLLQDWPITISHPRSEHITQLNAIRSDIMYIMRQAHQTITNQTH